MPNQYTISPGTVVGNQTVTGDLDVDTAQASAFELGVSATDIVLGINLKKDRATRFNAAKGALALSLLLADGTPQYTRVAPGGSSGVVGVVFGQPVQTSNVVNTGNTTENTIFSTTIHAGILGPQGVLRFRFYINTTVQGGVATTIRVKLGATTLNSPTISSVAVRRYDGEFANVNGLGTNAYGLELSTSAASPSLGLISTAVDTSVDQILAVTCQNGAATDSHQFFMLVGHIIPCEVNF